MDSASQYILTVLLFLLTVAVNLPFGYFRRRARRFSFRWFLYIHLPIPAIIIARVLSQLDIRYIPLFVAGAIIGQFWGGRIELQAK